MSEYQYYEFLAIDEFLSPDDMKALRDISRRATITPIGFANDYINGDINIEPLDLLSRYFDILLYYSNWGHRRVAFRFPKNSVDEGLLAPYLTPYRIILHPGADHDIIEISNNNQTDLSTDLLWESEDAAWITLLAPARDAIMRGDMRPLYIAWLMAVQGGELDEDDLEPPVPPGLGSPAPAQDQLARFMGVDEGLLAVAANASAELSEWRAAVAAWIAELATADKDRLLLEVATGDPGRAGAALLEQFHEHIRGHGQAGAAHGVRVTRRRVRDLLNQTAAHDQEMERERERRANDERRRRAAEAARKRAEYLATLAEREPAAWADVERLVSLRKPVAYERARVLLCDLRDLAAQQDTREQFAVKLAKFQKRHQRKSSLLVRLRHAGLLR